MGSHARDAFDAEALYIALDRQRRLRRMSWRGMCRDAGLSANNIGTQLGRGVGVEANTLARLLVWLGDTDLKPYIRPGVLHEGRAVAGSGEPDGGEAS